MQKHNMPPSRKKKTSRRNALSAKKRSSRKPYWNRYRSLEELPDDLLANIFSRITFQPTSKKVFYHQKVYFNGNFTYTLGLNLVGMNKTDVDNFYSKLASMHESYKGWELQRPFDTGGHDVQYIRATFSYSDPQNHRLIPNLGILGIVKIALAYTEPNITVVDFRNVDNLKEDDIIDFEYDTEVGIFDKDLARGNFEIFSILQPSVISKKISDKFSIPKVPSLVEIVIRSMGLKKVRWGEYVDAIVVNFNYDGLLVATNLTKYRNPPILSLPNELEATEEQRPKDSNATPFVMASQSKDHVSVKGIVRPTGESNYLIIKGYRGTLFENLPDPAIQSMDDQTRKEYLEGMMKYVEKLPEKMRSRINETVKTLVGA